MKHLSRTKRLKIEWCYAHGITSKAAIAKEVQVSLSTIYHEFKRNCWYWYTDAYGVDHKRYSADKAQQDYEWKNSIRGQHDKLGNNWEFITFIENEILTNSASPEIALHRWKQNHSFFVSVKTLYRYIDSGLYFQNLTNKDLLEKSLRKRPYNQVHKASCAPKGRSIEQRPSIVDTRLTFGHWEMDSVIGHAKGKKESILVLTERLTRFEIIMKVDAKDSKSTVKALRRLSRRCAFPALFKSITVDNGSEFQDCKGMEALGADIYYCHPYTSCERGSNERNNRIIRRFFPKGRSFAKITDVDCRRVVKWMNNYERRVLDFYTPAQLFEFYTSKENIQENLSQFY